jgi:hypothetical protein
MFLHLFFNYLNYFSIILILDFSSKEVAHFLFQHLYSFRYLLILLEGLSNKFQHFFNQLFNQPIIFLFKFIFAFQKNRLFPFISIVTISNLF